MGVLMMKISIKLIAKIGLLFGLMGAGAVSAETYILSIDSHCANRGTNLSFNCKPNAAPTSPGNITITKIAKNQWEGNEKGKKFPLDLIKEDSDILILNYPVLYSGIANIVLMKKTGRFYFSEIAYSGALKVQSYDVESGKFKKTK
jgi:hypothetical protein